MSRTIQIKRRKSDHIKDSATLKDKIENWVAFWRANPQKFISEYLGLRFKGDFQPVLFYAMDMYTHFIYVASRGLG